MDRQQPGRSAIPKHAVEKYTKERKKTVKKEREKEEGRHVYGTIKSEKRLYL